MLSPLVNLLKGLKLQCTLTSQMTDIEMDDIDLFLESDWPSNASLIQIRGLDEDQNVDITMDFEHERKKSEVSVRGSSATWVHGMGSQLEYVFNKARQRYYPIAEYWQIRSLMSLTIIFSIVWQLNHYLRKIELAQSFMGIPELQFLVALFLLSTWFLYPLNKALLWLFPHLEFADSPQSKIRKVFWSLLGILMAWITTEYIFPTLIP
jgi:hypothetical protein